MKTIKKLQLALVTVSIPLASFAQTRGFSDFDKDKDGLIENREFVTVFTTYYIDDWAGTEKGGLDDGDFYATTFAIIDKDDSDFIDEDEWDLGYDLFYGAYLYDNLAMYDVNRDGLISYTEYYDVLYDSDFFRTWNVDRDGTIDQYEFADGIFDSWDQNNNSVINKSEFNMLDQFFLGL